MIDATKETKRPTHAIYQVIDGEPKSRWNRIGAAWPNKDGKGFNLVFNSFPLIGRIAMREIVEADELAEQK
jgi:hypothetical protein